MGRRFLSGRGMAIGLGVAAGIAAFSPGPGRASDAAARLDRLSALDHRIGAIAHRLAVSNLALCPSSSGLSAGWTLHVLHQYGPDLREAARRRFHLAGEAPGIMAVAPDGPAERAGLRPGDRLVAIGDRALGRPDVAAPAGTEPHSLEAQIRIIGTALEASVSSGETAVTVERAGRRFQTVLTPVRVCASDFQVIPSPALHASADGRQVSISSGLADYAAGDDDLSLILAHELAHNILGHAEQLNRLSPARRWLGGWAAPPAALRRAEREADRLGLHLAAQAGYDISGAPAFWRRLARDHPAAGRGHWGHPSAESRAQAAEEALRDLQSPSGAAPP